MEKSAQEVAIGTDNTTIGALMHTLQSTLNLLQ